MTDLAPVRPGQQYLHELSYPLHSASATPFHGGRPHQHNQNEGCYDHRVTTLHCVHPPADCVVGDGQEEMRVLVLVSVLSSEGYVHDDDHDGDDDELQSHGLLGNHGGKHDRVIPCVALG